MELNYKAMGIRIRNARLKKKMGQELLAEMAGLSITHVSHIETGNTKVSLPTLVKISNSLDVSLDELVCDSIHKAKIIFENEISQITSDCDEREIRIISDVIKSLISSLRSR